MFHLEPRCLNREIMKRIWLWHLEQNFKSFKIAEYTSEDKRLHDALDGCTCPHLRTGSYCKIYVETIKDLRYSIISNNNVHVDFSRGMTMAVDGTCANCDEISAVPSTGRISMRVCHLRGSSSQKTCENVS